MTPIAAWLSRVVPQPLVLPSLVVIYTALMIGLLVFGGAGAIDIAYVDVVRK
jgi:hypothetical protein